MGNMFRSDKNVKGIVIGEKEYRLFQYADDTGILLDGSERCLESALHLLEQFAKYSGLKPNLDKTSCIWLGTKKLCSEILCPEKNLNWSKKPFVVLGIKFSTNLQEMIDLNFESKFNDIQKLIKTWSKRLLSVPGRITVVKTLLLSRLTHLIICLPRIENENVKRLEKAFFNFIWYDNRKKKVKTDRIARAQLIQDYSLGGMRMVHVKSFIQSMKLVWLQRFLLTDAPWTVLCKHIVKDGLESIFKFGDCYTKKIMKHMTNPFWKEVLDSFLHFRNLQKFAGNKVETIYDSLWYNDNILIGGEPVFYKRWYGKGIHNIGDLLTEYGALMTYTEFCNTYFTPMLTTFMGLRNSILEAYTWLHDGVHSTPILPHCPKYLFCILNNGRNNTKIYDILVESIPHEQRYVAKWNREFNIQMETCEWNEINRNIKTPMDVKLRWFQYRIVHRIISTNTFLYTIGIAESPLCTFCEELPETIIHLFLECGVVNTCVRETLTWLGSEEREMATVLDIDIVLGKPSRKYKTLNTILILLKYYIYKCRARQHLPTLDGCKQEVKDYFFLEEFIQKKNMKSEVFQKQWHDFIDILSTVE